MKTLLPALTLWLTSLALSAATANLPLHSADALIIEKLAKYNGLDAAPEVNPTKGWPALQGELSVRFAATDGKKVMLVGHDPQGRVTKLIGNGPLLANEAYGWLAGLPELRSIRIDHNIPGPGSPLSHALYDGSGLAALANSKLDEFKIGHALDDQGTAALAKVKALRVAQIGHSKVTDAGVAHFARHPNIEEFSISPQARPNRFTDKSLPVLATLPKLKRLGIHETFVTYEGGLKHLQPLKGRLESVSFKGALVLPADVEKLKADHPGMKVEISTPAEILAAPNSRGVERWATPEAVAYLRGGTR